MNLDLTIYAAFNDHGRLGIEALVDPSMTRAELVERIRTGDLGFDKVIRVVAFNPVEHTCDDISDDVFAEVEAAAQRLKDREDFPLSRFTEAAE